MASVVTSMKTRLLPEYNWQIYKGSVVDQKWRGLCDEPSLILFAALTYLM